MYDTLFKIHGDQHTRTPKACGVLSPRVRVRLFDQYNKGIKA